MSFGSPTLTSGAKGRAAIPANTSRVVQIAKKMPTLYEDVARLSSLTLKTAKKPVGDLAFGHNEQEPLPNTFVYSGADETSAGATLTLAQFTNSSTWIEDDILFNPRWDSLERLSLSGTPSTTVAAIRNIQGTTGLLKNGDTLIRIGNAREEGATSARASRMTTEEFKQFYLQCLNWTKAFTEPGIAAEQWNDPLRVNEHKKMMIEMKIDMELMLYFGYSSADIGGTTFGQPSSYGLHQHVLAGGNISSAQYLTFPEVENLLETPYNYGQTQGWICACSPFIAKLFNGIARGQAELSQSETSYGMRLKTLTTTFGDVDIMPLPLLKGPHLKSIAWFIPKPFGDFIMHRYLSGNGFNGDFELMMNTQTKESQRPQDEARTWMGYEFYENYKFAGFNRIVA